MHQKLIRLLALNQSKGQPLKAEVTAEEATIYLYDVIVADSYWGGISAIDFIKELIAITAPIIHLRVNSPGGDVFAALSMAQAMREHKSKIIVHVDGIAASATTFLVCAADESIINKSGTFMIHNAWTFAAGNANDFLKMADLLNKTDMAIADIYITKTNQSAEDIKAAMDAETYYFGQEAVDAGFIDSIAEETIKNSIAWDMSAYAKAPKIEDNTAHEANKQLPETKKIDLTNHYRRLELVNKLAA